MINAKLGDLPAGYSLQEESDILILRRWDKSEVTVFKADGTTLETIRLAAEQDSCNISAEDYQRVLGEDEATVRCLEVRFFGRFEILRNGRPLPLRRNVKALTILKHLLAHRDRAVSRDYLMGWLWPDSNLKKARWSLNSAIYELRELLRSWQAMPGSREHILLEDGGYRFSPQIQVSLDTEEFIAFYTRGRRLEEAQQITEALVEYEKAIDLYRGDYLIEDLYEDWAMIEREMLVNRYVDILTRLANYYMELGQYSRSIQICYKLLEKEPCHEDSYRMLIECYVCLGLRNRALSQYRLCEQMLKHKYGTMPSPGIQRLYQSLIGVEFSGNS